MRILIFNEFYYPNQVGGAEISTQLLAEGLVKLGHEVYVCSSTNIENEKNINGVSVHYITQNNIYWSYTHDSISPYKKVFWHLLDSYNFLNKYKIDKLIKKINPDIIHTNVISGFSCIIWEYSKRHHIPIVHTLRDYYLMCVRATLFHQNRNCTKQCAFCHITSALKKKMSRHVDAVIGISQFILNKHLMNGYFCNAILHKVIPNAVKEQCLQPTIFRKKIIGYLGRISPSKGIELLINSFLALKDNEYTLQIAGNGDTQYHQYLIEKYQSTKIEFVGRVKPGTFLRSISLLVVPSLWHEPFGRVVIEAQAAQCPVFVSNRGGMPELINEDNGKVFDVEKGNSLTYLLQMFVEGNLKFNFLKSNKLYSENTISKEYECVYKNIILEKK